MVGARVGGPNNFLPVQRYAGLSLPGDRCCFHEREAIALTQFIPEENEKRVHRPIPRSAVAFADRKQPAARLIIKRLAVGLHDFDEVDTADAGHRAGPFRPTCRQESMQSREYANYFSSRGSARPLRPSARTPREVAERGGIRGSGAAGRGGHGSRPPANVRSPHGLAGTSEPARQITAPD